MFTLLVTVQKCFFSTLDQVGLLGGLDDHKQFWVERFYCISDFFPMTHHIEITHQIYHTLKIGYEEIKYLEI